MSEKNECVTYFLIVGNFDINKVVEELGTEPFEKNECMLFNGVKNTYVSFGLCDKYETDIGIQMKKTMLELTGKRKELKAIKEKYECNFYLEVSPRMYVNETTPAFTITADIIEFCNDVGAEIDIDMYLYS